MCILPKQTFYFYFGFFLIGYIWIFSLYFYNNVIDTAALAQEELKRSERSLQHLDQEFDDTITVIEFDKPFPQNIAVKVPGSSVQPPCLTLNGTPEIELCIHPPEKDTVVSGHFARYREWEPALTAQFKKDLSSENDTVMLMDIGANIGYYSILAGKLGVPVMAIEPYPDSIALFYQSAGLNKISDKITLVQAAVSDKSGSLPMVSDSENYGNRFIINSEEDRFKFRQRTMLHTQVVVLDNFVPILQQNYPWIQRIVMKIDIQGHECFAIRGAIQLLKSYDVDPIFMEWEESRKLAIGSTESVKYCVREMLGILVRAGYRPFLPGGNVALSLNVKEASPPHDIIWRKV